MKRKDFFYVALLFALVAIVVLLYITPTIENYVDSSQIVSSTNNPLRILVLTCTGTQQQHNDVVSKIKNTFQKNYPSIQYTINDVRNKDYDGSGLTTANYDVVFISTDAPSFHTSPNIGKLVTALTSFVQSGGGIVLSAFASTTIGIVGFSYIDYLPTTARNNEVTNTRTGASTLGQFDSSDPIMTNVSTFDAGTSRFGSQNLNVNPGASIVAKYADGGPLIVKRTVGNARTVTLNFYPASSDVGNVFWNSSTDGATIMVNSILWAGKVNYPPADLFMNPIFDPAFLNVLNYAYAPELNKFLASDMIIQNRSYFPLLWTNFQNANNRSSNPQLFADYIKNLFGQRNGSVEASSIFNSPQIRKAFIYYNDDRYQFYFLAACRLARTVKPLIELAKIDKNILTRMVDSALKYDKTTKIWLNEVKNQNSNDWNTLVSLAPVFNNALN